MLLLICIALVKEIHCNYAAQCDPFGPVPWAMRIQDRHMGVGPSTSLLAPPHLMTFNRRICGEYSARNDGTDARQHQRAQ